MTQSDATAAIDPQWYRQVLGQYPTGVCVVTARNPGEEPVAMVVGSFTSVSLDPPLVAFFPDRRQDGATYSPSPCALDRRGSPKGGDGR